MIKTQPKIREEFLKFPADVQVFKDDRTQYRSFAMVFTFASGVKGVAVITHCSRDDWDPSEEIESIIIKTKKHDNKSVT